MTYLLGAHVIRPGDVPLQGTIVCAKRESVWGRPEVMGYDIVWADRTCSRKVTLEQIKQNGWVLPGTSIEPSECNRIWCDFQVERARALAKRHIKSTQSHGGPIEVDRMKRMASAEVPRTQVAARVDVVPKEMRHLVPGAAQPSGSAEPVRPASWHAKQLLSQAFSGLAFAVSTDRKQLSVGWLDGPVDGAVLRQLMALKEEGRTERIVLRRGYTDHLVQAAIDYVLHRVWGDSECADAHADRLRVTVEEFQGGSLCAMPPVSSPVCSVPYRNLIRYVLQRRDEFRSEFVSTPETKHLIEEVKFLFPRGDAESSAVFASFKCAAAERIHGAQRYTVDLGLRERG
jgi:hypothetical protein